MSEKVSKEKYPLLFEELNSEGVDLTEYVEGSHKRLDWECSVCGHQWTTELRVRTVRGCGCPHCNNGDPISLEKPARRRPQRVELKDSLGYLHPELVEMWDDEKNEYSVFDYKPYSGENANWICRKCGYSFDRTIQDMINSAHKCPKCAAGYSSSFGEQLIYFACVQVFGKDEVLLRDKTVTGFEIDVLVPKERIGFEYGAWRWHKDRIEDDISKIEKARDKGIRLYCIYDGLAAHKNALSGNVGHAFYIQEKTVYEDFVALRDYMREALGKRSAEIDWELVANNAKAAMHEKAISYEKSFECRYPDAVKEWDYEKNYPIEPSQVAAFSDQQYWFLCEQRHSYAATPDHKTSRHDGCPVCSHRQIIPGVNSFAAENPALMEYWNWDKNEEDPDMIAPLSALTKDTWYWKCPECAHEWSTKQSVTAIKRGNMTCPACHQRKGLEAILNEIRFSNKRYDYQVSPSLFPAGDIKDKEYRAKLEKFIRGVIAENLHNVRGNNKYWIVENPNVYVRILKGTDVYGTLQQCYILDHPLGEKTLIGKKGEAEFENVEPVDVSFGTRHPELMDYWDWDKNEKDPYDIPDTAWSQKFWYWKCPNCGKEWKSTKPPRKKLEPGEKYCPDCKKKK